LVDPKRKHYIESMQSIHIQYVVIIGLFSQYSTPLEALRWNLNRCWRKLPKNRLLLERKFSHGSTPLHIHASSVAGADLRADHASESLAFWRKRISSGISQYSTPLGFSTFHWLFFSPFHS
jgi:hypothetical protein